MEIFRFNILPLEEIERREAFKEAVNNCPACNAPLQISVEKDFLTNKIKEDCFCEACFMNVRSETYALQ